MATIKFLCAAGKYADEAARHDVIRYIFLPHKTPSRCIGGVGVNPDCAADEMQRVAEQFHKNSLTRLRHFVIAFYPSELRSTELANMMAKEICMGIGKEYQCIFAVHEDREYLHLHIVYNAVSFIDGHRSRGNNLEKHSLIGLVRSTLQSYGIRILYEVKYRSSGEED